MPSSYPTSLDSWAINKQDDVDTVTGVDAGTTTNVGDHAAHHNNLADAVNKIETELGINPSGTNATVASRFSATETVLNIKNYGAKGDARTVTDGVMTSGSAVLTSATAVFTAADVGKEISVMRATSTAFEQHTEIESINSTTSVELKDPLGFTGTGRSWTKNGNLNFTDGATTADSKTFTSATGAFVAADIGKQVRITGAGSSALNTTIASFQSATQVTLTANATKSVTGAQIVYGTNDTAALIAVLEAARDVTPAVAYAPKGTYLIKMSEGGTNQIRLYSNTTLRGDGWNTIFRSCGVVGDSGFMLGVNPWNTGTTNPKDNEIGVRIENLQLQGTTREDGFFQYHHLLALTAVTEAYVDWVKFSNWKGDAIYLGSGFASDTMERHNKAITIQDSEFDGTNWDNRNAISVIDGDDVKMRNCRFHHCTRFDMPGAIDMEPNPANIFPVIRNITVDGCDFRQVGGVAGAVCMAMLAPQYKLTTPQRGFTVQNCTFSGLLDSTRPIFMQQLQYPTAATVRNDVFIKNNWFYDLGTYVSQFEGVRGVEISNNYFIVGGAPFQIGAEEKCLDVTVSNNTFKEIGWWGSYCFELVQCENVTIDNNLFDNIGQSDLGGGVITRFQNGSSLAVPSGVTVTPGAGSGATTYGYRVTAMRDNNKETTASSTVTILNRPTPLTGANFNRVSWAHDETAAGFRVYGRTSGSELLMATLGPGVFTWDDTGAVTPSGALPGSNNTNTGNTRNVAFRDNIVRQGTGNRTTAIASTATGHTTATATLEFKDNELPSSTPNLAQAPFVDSTNKWKPSARVASTANVTLPPGGTTLTIDTVSLATGDRVLLKDQTTGAQNGLYSVDGIGTSVTLTRTADANVASLITGAQVAVDEGTQGDSIWSLTTAAPITLDTTSLTFKRMDMRVSQWQNVFGPVAAQFGTAQTATTSAMGYPVAAGPVTTGYSLLTTSIPTFRIDPADHAFAGKTLEWRVVISLLSNTVSPGTVTYTAGLYPITPAGSAGALTATIGTVVSGSTAAIVNPGASANTRVVGGTFTTTMVAAHYILAVVTSATMATNSAVRCEAQLQLRMS